MWVMVTAMTITTIAGVSGTVAIVVDTREVNGNTLTARNVHAKTPTASARPSAPNLHSGAISVAMTATTIAGAIGTGVIAVDLPETSTSGFTVKTASVNKKEVTLEGVAADALPHLGPRMVTVMMATITAAANGMEAIAVAPARANISICTARSVCAKTLIMSLKRTVAADAAVPGSRATNDVMMIITTVPAAGITATAADKMVTSGNEHIVKLVSAKTLNTQVTKPIANALVGSNAARLILRVMIAAMIKITTAVAIGTMVIAVATLETNCSGVIVLSASASIRHSKRTINALITKMAVSSRLTPVISDATTKITTACATGIMVIAVELQAISTSSTTAKNANALTQRTNRATGNAPTLHGKAMETAMIRITIAAVAGTAVTAARKPAPSSSSITAQNVFVEIPKLVPSVKARKIAASENLLATAAATMLTITAVATGTMVTVAGRMATSTNTSTACNANVKTRS